MNAKFFDLPKEKQDRMINAALKVFAKNGYRFASTDEMVKEAGISKGLLFHYFTSKLGLYTFVYEYSVRYMELELTAQVNPRETDFFAICKQIEIARLQAMKNYPYIQYFLNKSEQENVGEALLATEDKRNDLYDLQKRLNRQQDMSRFLPGADGEKIRNAIYYTSKGIMETHFQDGSFNAEMVHDEIASYIDMICKLTYKSIF